jgi:hypothetical protein
MTALLGLTLVLTAYTDVAGLPALPAICVGFLLPNADLLWRALRPSGKQGPADDADDRRRAIDETAGSTPDVWPPDSLDRLRDEWR